MPCIEIAFSNELLDSTGIGAKNDIKEDLGIKGIEKVRFTELYYLELDLPAEKIDEIARMVFLDPIVQTYSIGRGIFPQYDYYVEVRLHADVTDNLGIVAKEAIEDFLGKKIEGVVRSAKRYYISGKISQEDAQRMAKGLFANEIIETYRVGTRGEGSG